MESSFCGCDQGKLAGLHFDTDHLKDVGRDFCQALAMMKDADENLNIDKYIEESCCPRKCILRKMRRKPKCIQDKLAIHHITGIP